MDSKYDLVANNGSGGDSSFSNGFNAKRKAINGKYQGNGNGNGLNQNGNKKHKSMVGSLRLSGGSSSNSYVAVAPISVGDHQRSLPVYQVKQRLVSTIMASETIIIIGETGSGKTTQIPQYLHKATGGGMIAITQPRRVAAMTISKRVAYEMKCNFGELVGYTVRFEDFTTEQTKIKFVTDGCLLREALSDRLLKKYNIIILDEAHERTISTDVLFGIVKEAQRVRKERNMIPLKIIIMSATMDVDHFSQYFNNCEVVYLSGRTYPITIFHTKETQSDYQHACLSTLFQIHQTAPVNNDILVFLTGQEEIEAMATKIKEISKTENIDGPELRVFPLYSQLAHNKQMEVFQPIQPDTRKVVLSTNISETSLTINGIKYVIDSGMVKRKVYDSVTGFDILKVVQISQDQAWQRCGRAGRESAGFCYRTYTMADYETMDRTTVPEILRANITSTVLQLMALGINCRNFDFLDKPNDSDIEMALKELKSLGAIQTIDSGELTVLGKRMARFPLEPRFSKILLSAPDYGCLNEMLSLVALLSGENIFLNVDTDKRAQALTAHARFESKFGDHLTMLNAFKTFMDTDRRKTWCFENFMSLRNLTYAQKVREQLAMICTKLDMTIDAKQIAANDEQIRKCLISGLFNNIAELHITNNQYLTLINRQIVKIHPSSVLISKKPKCVLYTELVSTSHNFMRRITQIEPEWIQEIVPNCEYIKHLNYYS